MKALLAFLIAVPALALAQIQAEIHAQLMRDAFPRLARVRTTAQAVTILNS